MKKQPICFHFFLVISVVAILTVGCGKKTNPEGREDIRGTITFNGKPLDVGTIRFDPTGSDYAAGGSGPIHLGKYELTGIEGVKPGQYKVCFFASWDYDLRTGQPADENTPDGGVYKVKRIPPEFNTNSTLEFEVVQGKRNVFNYDIVTDYQPNTTVPKR